MLLNALTNYLQNQPTSSDLQSQQTQAPSGVSERAETGSDDTSPALYTVSDRAVMMSAVAMEFDIHALAPEQLGQFQNRLQEYGLIDNQGIQALSIVHTARLNSEDDSAVDAKAIIDKAYQQTQEPGTTYSQRKQIHQLHTLFSNLDSATPQQKAS